MDEGFSKTSAELKKAAGQGDIKACYEYALKMRAEKKYDKYLKYLMMAMVSGHESALAEMSRAIAAALNTKQQSSFFSKPSELKMEFELHPEYLVHYLSCVNTAEKLTDTLINQTENVLASYEQKMIFLCNLQSNPDLSEFKVRLDHKIEMLTDHYLSLNRLPGAPNKLFNDLSVGKQAMLLFKIALSEHNLTLATILLDKLRAIYPGVKQSIKDEIAKGITQLEKEANLAVTFPEKLEGVAPKPPVALDPKKKPSFGGHNEL